MPVARSASPKLRGQAEFRRVLQGGSRAGGNLLAVHILSSQAGTRVGFIAGRTVGGAVTRNRARRLMREAWRTLRPAVLPGTHVVFVSRPGIRTARMAAVAAEMATLLRRIGAMSA